MPWSAAFSAGTSLPVPTSKATASRPSDRRRSSSMRVPVSLATTLDRGVEVRIRSSLSPIVRTIASSDGPKRRGRCPPAVGPALLVIGNDSCCPCQGEKRIALISSTPSRLPGDLFVNAARRRRKAFKERLDDFIARAAAIAKADTCQHVPWPPWVTPRRLPGVAFSPLQKGGPDLARVGAKRAFLEA